MPARALASERTSHLFPPKLDHGAADCIMGRGIPVCSERHTCGTQRGETMDRDHGFRIRFTADERAMLRQLAEAQGVTSANVLRLYFRREHAAAAELRKPYLADLAKEKSEPGPTAKTKLTFKEVGGMWTSGDLTTLYPDHVAAKSSDADISRLKEL